MPVGPPLPAAVRKFALAAVKLDDLTLDGVLRDQVVDGYRPARADPEFAVGGLVPGGGVPSGIHVDSAFGDRLAEADLASPRRDQECVALAGLTRGEAFSMGIGRAFDPCREVRAPEDRRIECPDRGPGSWPRNKSSRP